MPNNFPRTGQNDLQNGSNFASYVLDGISSESSGKPLKTSASLAGTPQYAASSMSISDILQGTFSVSDPSDTLSVINKALTQDLTGLYNVGADSVSSFSSADPSGSLTGSGSTGTPGASSGVGSQLKSSWVNSLPTIHPTSGAVLWAKTGKASSEMHLPTSGDLATDVAQHKQYAELVPSRRHPWFMDRVGGPIGGQGSTNSDPTTNTVLNESATAPGQNGAFGYLDPVSEQFYCSMAWPYKGTEDSFKKAGRDDIVNLISDKNLAKSAYTGKRVMVYSSQTGLGCVCTPGDWGTQPYWSNGKVSRSSISGFYIGLAPDVHQILGTAHGADVILGWMPDTTPLGPYTATDPTQGTTTGGTSGSDLIGVLPDAAGSSIINTYEEMRYAGQMIANHPNCLMAIGGFKSILLDGFGVVSDNIKNVPYYYPDQQRGFLMPALLNMLWYLLEGGFLLNNYLGSYGIKQAAGDASRLSYHAKGGAIDIGALGQRSSGVTYQYKENGWRPVADAMFNYVSTLPKAARAKEYGCSFASDYNNGLHVYKDANPTHLHIGYDYNMAGELMPALKKRTGTTYLPPTGITVY